MQARRVIAGGGGGGARREEGAESVFCRKTNAPGRISPYTVCVRPDLDLTTSTDQTSTDLGRAQTIIPMCRTLSFLSTAHA